MITSKGKRALLILFAFIGSYLISYMMDPYSTYWTDYATRPPSDIAEEFVISIIFCAVVSELSLFLDRWFNRKMPWTVDPIKRLVVQSFVQILGVLLVTLITHFICELILEENDVEASINEIKGYWQWIIATVLTALMISAINTGNFLITNWKATAMEAAEHKIKAAEHKQAAAEAELQALKLQLDPHFVFNNLSVLSELILENQQLGYEYAENLSKVYRYLLVNSRKKLISLGEELKFLNAYLFLIEKRMGQGVAFEITVNQEHLRLQIPPLTLQLLIENALKHNRTTKDSPLQITMQSDAEYLTVSNTLLPLVSKADSAGIGLTNILSRYALLSDKKPIVEEDALVFTVKVPLLS